MDDLANRTLTPAEKRAKRIIEKMREWLAERCNAVAFAYGLKDRVDSRKLSEQGIYRVPTTHLGKNATALERRGNRTTSGDNNRQVGAEQSAMAKLEQSEREADGGFVREFSRQSEMKAELLGLETLQRGVASARERHAAEQAAEQAKEAEYRQQQEHGRLLREMQERQEWERRERLEREKRRQAEIEKFERLKKDTVEQKTAEQGMSR